MLVLQGKWCPSPVLTRVADLGKVPCYHYITEAKVAAPRGFKPRSQVLKGPYPESLDDEAESGLTMKPSAKAI